MKFRERIAACTRAVDSSLTYKARSRISLSLRGLPLVLEGPRSLGITVDDILIPDACRYPIMVVRCRKDLATYEMLAETGQERKTAGK